MGRSAMQDLAAIHDVLANQAPETTAFNERLRRDGVRAAVAERDAPFATR